MYQRLLKMSASLILTSAMQLAHAQETFPLYTQPIPGAKAAPNEEQTEQRDGITLVSHISQPTLTVYRPAPEVNTGTAVIVVPGGGYWVNAISHEGTDVARELVKWGITAVVLKYRIPDDRTMDNRAFGPLQDAQQAIFTVRSRAAAWGIHPQRIGIMGFSAGGHLASTLGTHFNQPLLPAFQHTSLRPDFMILVYPVISFRDDIGHRGSRDQLLGKSPSPDLVDSFSNETKVDRQTPPAFLVHATDDQGVLPDNSIAFYQALRAAGVPAEMHLYQSGGHGFGMENRTTADRWMDRLRHWMKSNGWLNPETPKK